MYRFRATECLFAVFLGSFAMVTIIDKGDVHVFVRVLGVAYSIIAGITYLH